MNILSVITDTYDRKARFYPAVLLVSPLIFTGVAVFSEQLTGLESLVITILSFGGAFLFTQLARDLGKNGEVQLFEKWGGVPSVTIFRHRDSRLDPVTKARYHNRLSALVKDGVSPTVEQEAQNSALADATYASWSNYLRASTRDKQTYYLLFQENVNYGYRRNVWGLRNFGIGISAFCMTVCGGRSYFLYSVNEKIGGSLVGAGIFSVALLLLWLFRFNSNWVKVPADAYAERLAECTEVLDTNK